MDISLEPTQGNLFNNQGTKYRVKPASDKPQIHFKHPNGTLFLGNSIKWLKTLDDQSIELVFADPPYNIKKANWDNFESQEEYIKWSIKWIKEVSRILKEDGSLYVCGFSEILSDIKRPAMSYFKSCKWLIWSYKNKANMGRDWGRSHESIVHFRKTKKTNLNTNYIRVPYGKHTLKYPLHPQAGTSQYSNKGKSMNWRPHPLGAKPKDVIEAPVLCNGMEEKTPHPTQKPEELIRKFVLASSKRDDTVVDPFSGAGTTLVVAEQLGRKWMGCELSKEYNEWAIHRIKNATYRTEKEWFGFDRRNIARRESIR